MSAYPPLESNSLRAWALQFEAAEERLRSMNDQTTQTDRDRWMVDLLHLFVVLWPNVSLQDADRVRDELFEGAATLRKAEASVFPEQRQLYIQEGLGYWNAAQTRLQTLSEGQCTPSVLYEQGITILREENNRRQDIKPMSQEDVPKAAFENMTHLFSTMAQSGHALKTMMTNASLHQANASLKTGQPEARIHPTLEILNRPLIMATSVKPGDLRNLEESSTYEQHRSVLDEDVQEPLKYVASSFLSLVKGTYQIFLPHYAYRETKEELDAKAVSVVTTLDVDISFLQPSFNIAYAYFLSEIPLVTDANWYAELVNEFTSVSSGHGHVDVFVNTIYDCYRSVYSLQQLPGLYNHMPPAIGRTLRDAIPELVNAPPTGANAHAESIWPEKYRDTGPDGAKLDNLNAKSISLFFRQCTNQVALIPLSGLTDAVVAAKPYLRTKEGYIKHISTILRAFIADMSPNPSIPKVSQVLYEWQNHLDTNAILMHQQRELAGGVVHGSRLMGGFWEYFKLVNGTSLHQDPTSLFITNAHQDVMHPDFMAASAASFPNVTIMDGPTTQASYEALPLLQNGMSTYGGTMDKVGEHLYSQLLVVGAVTATKLARAINLTWTFLSNVKFGQLSNKLILGLPIWDAQSILCRIVPTFWHLMCKRMWRHKTDGFLDYMANSTLFKNATIYNVPTAIATAITFASSLILIVAPGSTVFESGPPQSTAISMVAFMVLTGYQSFKLHPLKIRDSWRFSSPYYGWIDSAITFMIVKGLQTYDSDLIDPQWLQLRQAWFAITAGLFRLLWTQWPALNMQIEAEVSGKINFAIDSFSTIQTKLVRHAEKVKENEDLLKEMPSLELEPPKPEEPLYMRIFDFIMSPYVELANTQRAPTAIMKARSELPQKLEQDIQDNKGWTNFIVSPYPSLRKVQDTVQQFIPIPSDLDEALTTSITQFFDSDSLKKIRL